VAKKMPDDDRDGPTADDFLKHYNKIRRKLFEKDQAVSSVRIALKAAKSDGVNLKSLKLMMEIAKLDTDEAAAMLKQFGFYSRVSEQDFANAVQGDLFELAEVDAPKAKTVAEFRRANEEAAGRHVGAHGGNKADNPNQPGTEAHQAWDVGFNAGWEFWVASGGKAKAERAVAANGRGGLPGPDAMAPVDTGAAAAPKRRGRPPAAAVLQ